MYFFLPCALPYHTSLLSTRKRAVAMKKSAIYHPVRVNIVWVRHPVKSGLLMKSKVLKKRLQAWSVKCYTSRGTEIILRTFESVGHFSLL